MPADATDAGVPHREEAVEFAFSGSRSFFLHLLNVPGCRLVGCYRYIPLRPAVTAAPPSGQLFQRTTWTKYFHRGLMHVHPAGKHLASLFTTTSVVSHSELFIRLLIHLHIFHFQRQYTKLNT